MKAARALELCKGVYSFPKRNGAPFASVLSTHNAVSVRYSQTSVEYDSRSRQDVPEIPTSAKSSILGNLKRGRGGRSSFSGIVATVFGASGFLGRYIGNELGKIGSQVIIAHRCDPYDIRDFKLMGDLGQILYQYCDARDEAAIRRSIKYSNVVINLIGRDYETKGPSVAFGTRQIYGARKNYQQPSEASRLFRNELSVRASDLIRGIASRNFKFNDVHVDIARRIARLTREAGVERLIHFSALNASDAPQPLLMRKGSNFLKSKALGEQAVREEFPNAIIFRPSDMYGAEDRFLNYYKWWFRRNWYWMPLYKMGDECIKQPVYVGDVARAVVNSITDPDAPGKIYEAVGPRRYVLGELVDYIFEVLRRGPETWGYTRGGMDPITRLKIFIRDHLPYQDPIMGIERVEREHTSDKRLPGLLGLEDLGVSPLRTIESYAHWHLMPYRLHNDYTEELGEFPTPLPPRYMPDEKQTELWKLYHSQSS